MAADPISLGLMAAQTALQVGQQLDEGKRKDRAAQLQATAIQKNAQLQAREQRAEARSLVGRQRTQAAANGLLVSGSILDVMIDDAAKSAAEEQNIMTDASNRAAQLRFEGKIAKENSVLNSIGTVLSTGANFASSQSAPFGAAPVSFLDQTDQVGF